MKTIKIFDTTLRDGEQSPGCSMNIAEKLEITEQLEKLQVDVIEAGFANSSVEDFEAVRQISKAVKNAVVTSLSRALKADIDRTYQAIKYAVKPRIHLFLSTSDIHMKHKLKKTPSQVLEIIKEHVRYSSELCGDVEFSAEDATRSEPAFLAEVFSVAIENGANVINIPDTVGYCTPEEMYKLVKYIKQHVNGVEKVDISTHCHDDLGLATANSLAAMRAGATQIECTINGIGERAGNASLEEIVMGIKTRESFYDVKTNIDSTRIYRTSRLLSSIIGIPAPPNKSIIGANAFAHESGIHQHGVIAERTTYEIMTPQSIGILENKMILGKHSGKHGLLERITALGYNLNEKELEDAFVKFKTLAEKKRVVTDLDIEAIAGQRHINYDKTYKLINYSVSTGTSKTPYACVHLSISDTISKIENEERKAQSKGDGPIDAVFKAIDIITEKEHHLDSYTIRSVTEGEDAMGEVIVKIKHENNIITGRGLSTDIIESSIFAYLNAIAKI